MNLFVFLPFLILVAPILPAFIEIFRRRDKGPRKIPEQTLYEEKADTSKALPMIEKARARSRLKITGEIIRIVGNISIPEGVEIKENIVVHGNLWLGRKCHIHGSIKTFGEAEVGEDSVIEGHIISDGKVTIGQNARVNGIIDSAGDIILMENTVVEGISTEKSVRLAPGAKISQRILPSVSITAPSPLTAAAKEEEIQAGRALQVTVPPFSAFFEGRKSEEALDEKGRLFQTLQNRMRSLDELKRRTIVEARLERLTQREAEIYKLTVSGYNVDEIGLRLLIDPVQVREVINSLIKRGYLDENLKPLRPEGAEETQEKAVDVTHRLEAEREKPEVELPVEEVFERLLASKLRLEVKGILESEERGESTTKAEMREILKEWQEASSLLFGPKEKKNHNNLAKNPDQVGNTNPNAPDSAGSFQETESENAAKPLQGKYWKGLLPLSTLLSVLFTEIAYYNPSIFLFLKGLMPPTFKIWMLFMGLTITFAMITSVYSAKSILSQN